MTAAVVATIGEIAAVVGTERGTGGNTEEVTKARGRGREVLRTEILEIQMRERKIHRAGVEGAQVLHSLINTLVSILAGAKVPV